MKMRLKLIEKQSPLEEEALYENPLHRDLLLIATSPNGVKILRDVIVKLAMQGKLIATRRANWTSGLLGKFVTFEYGKGLARKVRVEGNYPVYGSNGIVGYHSAALIKDASIIIGRKGSAGALNLANKPFWATDVTYYSTPPKSLDIKFYYFLLYTLNLSSLGKGIKPGLNRNEAYRLAISYPSVEEQKKIICKLEELMSLCDALEMRQSKAEATHRTLIEVLLDNLARCANAQEFNNNWKRIQEHADEIFTTEESIDALQRTLLQLAVKGKLVPQNSEDESSEVLLRRLHSDRRKWLKANAAKNSECRNFEKKLSKLPKAKSPFPLPKSWVATQIANCSRLLVDCHNKTAPYSSHGIPIIRTSNIRNRKFRLRDLKYVSQDTYQFWSRRCAPEPGDIILTREAPMGEAAIIPNDAKFCLGQRTMLIRPMHDFIDKEYLLIAITEPHLLERALPSAVGATVKHLRVGDVERLVIPLPPFAEQKRIVSKVNELFVLCNKLKEKLAIVRRHHEVLATELVKRCQAN